MRFHAQPCKKHHKSMRSVQKNRRRKPRSYDAEFKMVIMRSTNKFHFPRPRSIVPEAWCPLSACSVNQQAITWIVLTRRVIFRTKVGVHLCQINLSMFQRVILVTPFHTKQLHMTNNECARFDNKYHLKFQISFA